MTVFICADDHNGVFFNRRRQSRDRSVISDVMTSGCDRILVSEYSRPLFEGMQVTVSDALLEEATARDGCFVEGCSLLPFDSKIRRLILYRWNRAYPADTLLDLLPEQHGFVLTDVREFTGSSHERITKEVWIRE